MRSIIKGFFLGIFFVVAFTLILAPMTESLISEGSGEVCSYGCAIQGLMNAYKSPMFILLFGAFWFLGAKILSLSSLISEKSTFSILSDNKKLEKRLKYPWEHKLSIVEDKE
jgi:hypothetical protein